MDLTILENFLSFSLIGFITWYGTGLDDLLFMSVIFKRKSHRQKVVMFFGNLAAVSLIVLAAVILSRFSHYFNKFPLVLRIPGLLPLIIGFLEIRSLSLHRRRSKRKRKLKKKDNWHLFSFAFLLYIFNSVDDFMVTSSIFFANSEWYKVFPYGIGFVFGSVVSLYLASKFSKITQKISFLEFLAPVVLIIIGTLILFGFFMPH